MDIKKVEVIIDLTKDEIVESFSVGNKNSAGLNMTGIEFFTYLGFKVVIPIVMSFVSRLLYDKYKDLKDEKSLENAMVDLRDTDIKKNESVSKEEVSLHLISVLKSEGIPEEKAEILIESAFKKMKGINE